nr:Polysaccharide biosynthesis protein CapD domain containing protein [Haemonchus contortus]
MWQQGYILREYFRSRKRMLSYFLHNGLALLPGAWIEMVVMIQVYILAAYCALKELLYEAANQGIKKRLENEIRRCRAIRSAHTKRVFITGADGTIGREVVKKFLRYDYTVHALVGDRQKAKVMFESLNGSQLPLTFYEVDFADPHEVTKFARGFLNRCGEIHVMVFCAGTMLDDKEFIGDVERHMCVNVVSQALLLDLLGPLLVPDARILFLSSSTAGVSHYTSSILQGDLLTYHVGPYQAYCLSKLVLSVYVEELARHRPHCIATMHPGVIPGTLYRHTNMFVRFVTYFILPFLLRRSTFSALHVVHTCLRDDLVSGSYYEDEVAKRLGDKLTEKDKQSIYKAVQKQVQEWSRLED